VLQDQSQPNLDDLFEFIGRSVLEWDVSSRLGPEPKNIGGLKPPLREGHLDTSARKGCPDGSHVEKHPLWSRRRSTFDGHKTIPCIPADPIPIGVCDDASTANFIGHAHADVKRLRNQGMAKSPTCESPIHG
jgi:hypothetical protein